MGLLLMLLYTVALFFLLTGLDIHDAVSICFMDFHFDIMWFILSPIVALSQLYIFEFEFSTRSTH